MEAVGSYIIKAKPGQEFRFHSLGDIHLGTKGCHEPKFKEKIDEIAADPHARWWGHGDYCDSIGYTDKRFDPEDIADWLSVADLANLAEAQFNKLFEYLEPIKDKCIGLCLGNHELKILQRSESLTPWTNLLSKIGFRDGQRAMASRDFRYSSLFNLVFEISRSHSETFRVAVHHGAGGSSTEGGKINRLRDFMNWIDADIVCIGHSHIQAYLKLVTLGANKECTKLAAWTKHGIVGGTYYAGMAQGFTSYAEIKGYRPTALGNPKITIVPETRFVDVTWPQ